MEIKSSYAFIILSSLFMSMIIIQARKDNGEYWRGGVRDMPEELKSLVHADSMQMKSKNCNEHSLHKQTEEDFNKEFEPRPNVSAYPDDSKVAKDFEPRPNVSAYADDSKVANDFEPRPNVSAYPDDDIGVRKTDPLAENEKPFSQEFDPRPNVSIYHE